MFWVIVKRKWLQSHLSEKKSSTKDFEIGTDELADTLFTEKKSLKKYVDKGTYELADTLLMEHK